jgi:hypothetical protein
MLLTIAVDNIGAPDSLHGFKWWMRFANPPKPAPAALAALRFLHASGN